MDAGCEYVTSEHGPWCPPFVARLLNPHRRRLPHPLRISKGGDRNGRTRKTRKQGRGRAALQRRCSAASEARERRNQVPGTTEKPPDTIIRDCHSWATKTEAAPPFATLQVFERWALPPSHPIYIRYT